MPRHSAGGTYLRMYDLRSMCRNNMDRIASPSHTHSDVEQESDAAYMLRQIIIIDTLSGV